MEMLEGGAAYSFLSDRRHDACGEPSVVGPSEGVRGGVDDGVRVAGDGRVSEKGERGPTRKDDWRMRERLKTVSVALVLCLNIGIDPPDILKTTPCAKTECWIDPLSLPPQKALETIGKNLQQQYEVWQPRARYKTMPDPSIEETKKSCLSLRKNAKDERILFHYNGHGVPKPTKGGEIWVFNKSYTQYLPCSIYDIQSWLGSPCIYVFDCSNAGNILLAFDRFADQRDEEHAKNPDRDNIPYISMKECILLAACGPTDTLPMNPDLPADLFTCCLTTPIEIALRWFVSQNPLLQNISPDMIMKIPGQLNDRRTALGELNWIFTAITDTIAWNILPHDVFKKLFRQDLMVAALFRNFLLAERIMRYYHCTPMSFPKLPGTHQHPLWSSWDLAAEMCLYQLPGLLKTPPVVYQHSSFFSEQLTAFEVWLSKGPIATSHPEQLPIVLQVLLSQVHRLRALMLLSRFLDLGPWSVKLALSVGIFPYVLKLLQSPAAELKPVLVFIWAKILALDSSCQSDLLKDNGFTYFINILTSVNSASMIPNMSEHRAMCCFILSVFCHGFRFGQEACLKNDLLLTLSLHLNDPDPLLRQWVCIALAKMIENFPTARDQCLKEGLHERLLILLTDMSSEVRTSAIFAISALIQGSTSLDSQSLLQQPPQVKSLISPSASALAVEMCICNVILSGLADASPIVRKELVILLSRVVGFNLDRMIEVAFTLIQEEKGSLVPVTALGGNTTSTGSMQFYICIYKALLSLSVDPFPLVARLAAHLVDGIHTPLVAQGRVKTAPAAQSKRLSTMPAGAVTGAAGSFAGPQPLASARPPRKISSMQADMYSMASGGPSAASGSTVKRNSSFLNGFKGFQGLASLVSFPVSGSLTGHERDLSSTSSAGGLGSVGYKQGGDTRGGNECSQPRRLDVGKCFLNHLQADADGSESVTLKSTFYDWSLEYFREPQMKVPDIDDPGSTQFNQKLWRHQQNERSANISVLRSQDPTMLKFDNQVNFLHSDNNPGTHLYFHPFEPHLLGADDADGVIVYNWEDGTRLNWFSNSNPPGTRITSLRFINENDIALVVTGSDEGIVRIYKNYSSLENCEIVSSWRAVNENLPTTPRADLITDWHQKSGSLLVAGDLRMIRVWDVERELCVQDIGTKYQLAVTSLTSEKREGNLLIAGYADGLLNVYDKRMASRESLIMSFREHSSRILSCKLQNDGYGNFFTLASGAVAGDVRFWDIRNAKKSLRTIGAVPSGVEMTALAIHEDAPLFACGTNTEYIRIFNVNGVNLNTIRYNDGFLGPRIGHVGCLAFHPYRDLLAAGTTGNASLSLFSSSRG
ncbi:raptor N-terminal caspase like domain-containing protein [Chytriomyces sp. MP71]|nr:raptor N-terminal caspase like domain-containing protein [Chytriomyces sp. MP71]